MPNIVMADKGTTPTFKKITDVSVSAQNSVDITVPDNVKSNCVRYVLFLNVTFSASSKFVVYANSATTANRVCQMTSNANSASGAVYVSKFTSETNGSITAGACMIGQSTIGSSGLRTTVSTPNKFVVTSATSGSTMTGTIELWGWV